jgi:hypothetical protein
MDGSTIKASNFEPHVNFHFYSRMACYHQNASYKTEEKERCKKCQFCSFLGQILSKEAKELA